MRKFKIVLCVAATAFGLASCGDTALEQGALGAGAGVGAAIITGGDAKTGAVIGGLGNLAYCQTYPSRCN